MPHNAGELARDFQAASMAAGAAVFTGMQVGVEVFKETWRSNAEATSGSHGKHYPKSITSQMHMGMVVRGEVGPESGMKQGGMGPGFEFGSQNQPPHLDGARALPAAEVAITFGVAAALDRILP